MPIIDAQVHAYERNHPGRPWAAVLHGPAEVTGDEMVAAMDAVGVDGALLVSPFTMYRWDASYAIEVHAKHPGRFALIKPVDPTDPAVAETIADWAATPGTVGIRIMMNRDVSEDPADPGINRVLAAGGATRAAGEHPVLGPSGAGAGAGGAQPGHDDRDRPSGSAAAVRAAAAGRSLSPSCRWCWSSAPSRTSRSRSPAPARSRTSRSRTRTSGIRSARIFDAFGIDRCMWGTDWTRAVELLTYKQGVDAFRVTDRLSESEKAALMGGSAAARLQVGAEAGVTRARFRPPAVRAGGT